MKKTKPSKTDQKQDLQIKKLETELNQIQDKLKRSLADYSNLEKRIDRDRQLLATLAATSIVIKMIEVLDDLELVSNHLADPGLKMVVDKFEKVLQSEGLEVVKAHQCTFDPETMDCVDVCKGDQDQVVKVQKKGYKLNGRVIRPAQVVVGRSEK